MEYEQRKITLPEITDDYLAIALHPQPLQLQEMVVKPLDPLDIVGLSLDRIPENYLSIPYTARGFQREYVTANEQFIQLMEVTFLTQATRDPGPTRVLDARYLENKRRKLLFGILHGEDFTPSAGPRL